MALTVTTVDAREALIRLALRFVMLATHRKVGDSGCFGDRQHSPR
jgi:hypothetical protein